MKLMFFLYIVFHSAEMLVNLSIPWVILGHSERRALLNESNEVSYVMMPLVLLFTYYSIFSLPSAIYSFTICIPVFIFVVCWR